MEQNLSSSIRLRAPHHRNEPSSELVSMRWRQRLVLAWSTMVILVVASACGGEEASRDDTVLAETVVETSLETTEGEDVATDIPGEAAGVAEVVDGGDILTSDAVAESVGDDTVDPLAPFRVAILSDTHVTLLDVNPADQHFMATGEHLASLDPPIARVFVTGDVVEDLFCMPDITCETPLPVLVRLAQLVDDYYPMPVHFVLGNHDNRFLSLFLDKATPWQEWQAVFPGPEPLPTPYYVVEQGGFAFVVLDATDQAVDYDSNDDPTFGPEQLAWLDGVLSQGAPAIVMWHHFFDPAVETDSPVLPVLEAHADTVRAVFTGHQHAFLQLDWKGIPFYETDDSKTTEAPSYHLVECDPALGTISVTPVGPNAPTL